MRERWFRIALCALAAQVPFELRYTLFGLSNLQWTFVVVAAASVPLLFENRQRLLKDRLVQAAILFVGIQWLVAVLAPEFHSNAFKAAARFTAGLLLLSIARIWTKQEFSRVWVISSMLAAIYSLVAYAGFGWSWLFRTEEFYLGQIQRLSGSFEYPNIAGAYFAMSLPIVWWSSFRPAFKWIVAFLLWCSIVLTFSKGALIAAIIVLAAGPLLSRSRTAEWKSAITLLGIGIAAYICLLPLQPFLWERIYGPGVSNPTAEYGPSFNKLRQQPGANEHIPLRIRNTGIVKWRATGWRKTAVGYRWWNPETQNFLKFPALTTALPHDVDSGETVEVSATVRTPDQPGRYILVLELCGRNMNWFSQTGVIPVLIETEIQRSASRSVGQTDLSPLYRRGRMPGTLTASVSRSSLWTAALKMFASHPIGVGPDNFRLQYGRYLNASRWDKNVYSNNLYLELLSGSGLLGLASFGLILAFIPWRRNPFCLALAVFLVHGLVDVFLMTTPIYFSFWILVGMGSAADYADYTDRSA